MGWHHSTGWGSTTPLSSDKGQILLQSPAHCVNQSEFKGFNSSAYVWLECRHSTQKRKDPDLIPALIAALIPPAITTHKNTTVLTQRA